MSSYRYPRYHHESTGWDPALGRQGIARAKQQQQSSESHTMPPVGCAVLYLGALDHKQSVIATGYARPAPRVISGPSHLPWRCLSVMTWQRAEGAAASKCEGADSHTNACPARSQTAACFSGPKPVAALGRLRIHAGPERPQRTWQQSAGQRIARSAHSQNAAHMCTEREALFTERQAAGAHPGRGACTL